MPRGKPPKRGGAFGSRIDNPQTKESIIRIERKEIHGQIVDVKICSPGNSTNPIEIRGTKKQKANNFYEPDKFSLGPISSGLHGSKTTPSFRDKKKDLDEEETES